MRLLRAIQRLGPIRYSKSGCGGMIYLKKRRKRGRNISEASGQGPEVNGELPYRDESTTTSRATAFDEAQRVHIMAVLCSIWAK